MSQLKCVAVLMAGSTSAAFPATCALRPNCVESAMRTFALSVWFAIVLFVSSADAATLNFFNITNNNAADAAAGEAQLSVTVSDNGGGQVLFTFNNAGPAASSITEVYFDDNASLLAASATIINGSGVTYAEGASPGNLPGGDPLGFDATYDADSNAPPPTNGVNPGETLGLVFALLGGSDFDDVLNALAGGQLLIGIHVQAFASGGSESFINVAPIPVPAAFLLYGSGLALVGFVAWKKKRRPAAA